MADPCDKADGPALTAIAEALAMEIPVATGEAGAGRRRLLESINSKIAGLGLPTVSIPQVPAASPPDLHDLIERGIADERLCAHTRNFLQTALSRLERFDETLPPVEGGATDAYHHTSLIR
jgi:hypothetical protein